MSVIPFAGLFRLFKAGQMDSSGPVFPWRCPGTRQRAGLGRPFRVALLGLNNRQYGHGTEMPLVESCLCDGPFQSWGGDDEVIGSNHFARRFKLSPDSRGFISGLCGIWQDGKRTQHGLPVWARRFAIRMIRG